MPIALLSGCATTARGGTSAQVAAERAPERPTVLLGMVGPVMEAVMAAQDSESSFKDSESSFKGKPGDMQDSSFAGRPGQNDPNAVPPSGVGFNQKPGELMPQVGGGDVHYHSHYYGNAGYSTPAYGTPVQNGTLGTYNLGHMSAPIGTGGGGAGWYGPNYATGPLGLRQGYGPGRGYGYNSGWGWGTGSGAYNGYTD
jgi:hypothetical protein